MESLLYISPPWWFVTYYKECVPLFLLRKPQVQLASTVAFGTNSYYRLILVFPNFWIISSTVFGV